MEEFFRKLARVLQEKYAAFTSGDAYTPFLGKVIIDVASPETRELGANDLLLSRLDEISSRLGAVEGAVRRPRATSVPVPNALRGIRDGRASGEVTVEVPEDQAADFSAEAISMFEIDSVEKVTVRAGLASLAVRFSGAPSHQAAYDAIQRLAKKHGGDIEVPF